MKFDLKERGLHRVLKPYQAESLRFIWGVKEAKSVDVFTHLQCQDNPKLKKSRSTVINSLDMMVHEGLLGSREESGMGGFHKVYFSVHANEGEFRYWVAGQISEAVSSFLEEYEEEEV